MEMSYSLEAQLPLLKSRAKSMGFNTKTFNGKDLITMFQTMSPSRRILLSELVKLMKLLLVLPAANSISERSFPALKKVKTYF